MIIERKSNNPFYQRTDIERYHTDSIAVQGAGDVFEVDLSQIIHSGAFRRMQAKTQVIGMDVSDLQRTRLTHSMEVSHIARQIVTQLNQTVSSLHEQYALDGSLIEASALAHDLGHPPFGHRGEEALNQCMQRYGGFEANAQTFRLLTHLEGELGQGLNVTRGLLLSIMKYPILFETVENREQYQRSKRYEPPKTSVFSCDEERFHWTLTPFSQLETEFLQGMKKNAHHHHQTLHKTLECSIIEIADDVAYGTHDVEDAINLGFIRFHELKEILRSHVNPDYPLLVEANTLLDRLHPESDRLKYRLKKVFTTLISAIILAVEIRENKGALQSPRLKYHAVLPDDLKGLINELHALVAEEVIYSQRVQTVAFRGSYMIQQLFQALMNDKSLLPKNDRQKVEKMDSDHTRARIVCDYIAGMTDSFAMKMYARLFGQSRSFFDY